MKAVLKAKPERGAEIRHVDVPKIGPRDVLIKVIATSICGTDVHIYSWDPWSQRRIVPPRIFGHEFVGEVVEAGKQVETVGVGDYVSAETHIACGHCYMCRTGKAHICLNVKILGVDVDGSFAEYIAVPEANIWKTDRAIPPEIACLQEPFGNAVHAALVEDVAGKTVSVFGCGPIGLMSIAVCAASGATKIFAVETDEYRLGMAEPLGATRSIHALEEDAVRVILEETGGLGVEVFLEMSGAEAAIAQGLKSLRKGGRASFLGITPGDIKLDLNDGVVFKQAVLYGINGRVMFDTWYKASELLGSGKIDLKPLVTHTMKLDEFQKGMDLLLAKKACKVVMYPTEG